MVVAALVAVAALGWAWRHPGVTFHVSYGLKVEREVSETAWTSVIPPGTTGADEVTLTALEPRFASDSAAATVEYLVCDLDPAVLAADGVGSFGFGMPDDEVDRTCASTRPAEGAVLHLQREAHEELIVGITPTRPGRVRILAHDVGFRVGWRRGADRIGVEVVLVPPRADRQAARDAGRRPGRRT